MKLIYKGKTKDVYKLDNDKCLLKFKDDVTGAMGVFDPGANTVGLTIEGAGKSGLKLSRYFFEKLNSLNIPTHYLSSDIDNATMTVKAAKFFGEGLEVILRYRAVGSFYKRYALYCKMGQKLQPYVEMTLKDDQRNDPLITQEALQLLNIMNKEEYDFLVVLTKKIGNIIKEELAKQNLELYDIKLEFGRIGEDNHIALIDEISGGNMRVYLKNEYIKPIELEKIMFKEI